MSASTTCELSTSHCTTILFSKLSELIGDMLAISGVEKEYGKRLLVSQVMSSTFRWIYIAHLFHCLMIDIV